MEIIIDIDRVDCIAKEFARIVNTMQFKSAKLVITPDEIYITPIAHEIKITLTPQKKGE